MEIRQHFLDLQKFIIENQDWEFVLSNPPYNLIIKRDPSSRSIIFKYNQILSDMNLKICREARGVILDDDTFYVRAIAFDKFFNYGESLAADIDWASAKVKEKIDGSLIKIYKSRNAELTKITPNSFLFASDKAGYGYPISIATNGTVDARTTELPLENDDFKTFWDLVIYIILSKMKKIDTPLLLDPDFTYLFEVVSKYNRVVVPYQTPELYFLGVRCNIDGREFSPGAFKDTLIGDMFKVPRDFDFDLQSVKMPAWFISQTAKLGDPMNLEGQIPGEGFVVVDKDFNRIKIKGEKYLTLHKLKGESNPTPKRIVESILNETADDFLGIYPEYKQLFEPYMNALSFLIFELKTFTAEFVSHPYYWIGGMSQKEYALTIANKFKIPSYAFNIRSMSIEDVGLDYIFKFLKRMPVDSLLKYLNSYLEEK